MDARYAETARRLVVELDALKNMWMYHFNADIESIQRIMVSARHAFVCCPLLCTPSLLVVSSFASVFTYCLNIFA